MPDRGYRGLSRQVSGFSPKSVLWPLHGWVGRVADHVFSRSDLAVPNPPSISPPFGPQGTSLRPATDLGKGTDEVRLGPARPPSGTGRD